MTNQPTQELDVLANRFNKEAVVMLGASQQEFIRGGLFIVIPTAILTGLITLLVWGWFLFGLAGGMIIGVAAFLVIFKRLEKYRKGKALGYLTQSLQATLSKNGLAYTDVIHKSGSWMIGRYL